MIATTSIPDGYKLNLGCGPVQPSGWVNIDGSRRARLASRLPLIDRLLVRAGLIPPTEFGPQVMVCDLFKRLPFEDDSVACVYAGEVWEHFERPDSEKLTRECYRVLKRGGVLRVCVPDDPQYFRRYLECLDAELAKPRSERSDAELHRMIQLYWNNICTRPKVLGFMGHTHKWSWDEVQLVSMFEAVGFSEVDRMRFYESRIPDVNRVERSDFLIVEGVKPNR